ncbi:amidohydrolase [Clostridium estertheticum]|uniref:Hydrolase n=1 Tax=Clostridium estertheticum subsp. estertheticum TaxID=1552 RepID=A0A1J0GGG7_9CLOT|nr:amidohydrolase [Clostridium estertheticum]APC40395.1 hydrolase [Clostridium estertheticum subsp. estertheticum]MBZ9617786.1 amidohydrolase [Clostridium estertheticum subsp. laramiense]WAG73454.1 amidohydrolase [Clostridium estertheticum]
MGNEKLSENINNLEKKLIEVRHNFHKHPELSNEEFETTKTLRKLLNEAQIRILKLPLKTGLVAEITGDREGPIIAIRGDIDALPIIEETELEYKSQVSGKMHACGHDFHASVILGAAYLLKQQESTLEGTVRIIFQPAEELGHGAEDVLASGALSNVAAIFGLHSAPELELGSFGTKVGAMTAAVDRFEIEIEGIGTHASSPEKGIDPIIVAAHIITSLQTIVSRSVSTFDQVLISVTHIESGNTWNVIPNKAYIEGTVRTVNANMREFVPSKMRQIIKGVADSFGATAELKWYSGPPATNNTKDWTEVALEVAQKQGYVIRKLPDTLIGEDFAFYQEKIPGAFVKIGTGVSYSLHHPKFKVDDAALLPAANYFSELAKRALVILKEK